MATTKDRSYLFGTPIAWIAVYAALVGVTSLIPILPYAGGGGYWPLATPLACVAPLLLGPIGGIISALVGGIIGMFIAPPAYPLGILDATLITTFPAIFTGLALNMKKYWKIFLVVQVLSVVAFFVSLFSYPGLPGGWSGVSVEGFIAESLWYWLVPSIVLLSPIGTKYINDWARSDNARNRSIGIFLGAWMGMNAYYISPAFWVYWILFEFPTALLYLMFWAIYTWYMVLFAVLITVITVPLAQALKKSGLARPKDAIW
jgi:hypothetical protein